MTTTTVSVRPTLAALNEGFRSTGETADFETVREYRVGKWGTRWSRDGYASRGVGGDKLHVSVVTAITAIKPDYDWRTYCVQSLMLRTLGGARSYSAEKRAAMIERQVAEHGQPWHYCQQPKVGDVLVVKPVCRFENVRGTNAWEAAEVDTDRIDCLNCRRQFFHEEVDGVAERRAEREAVESRKASRPQPARCFWCGDIRPRTKATQAGEHLPCSRCKDDFETIYWVETTGFSNKYFADMADQRDPQHDANMRALGVEDETKACDRLERVEGKYFR